MKPVVTSYTYGGITGTHASFPSSGNAGSGTIPTSTGTNTYSVSANRPNATLTDVIIRAITGSGLVTMGLDEARLYNFAIS